MSDTSISGSKDYSKEVFNTFKLKKKELISYW